MLLARLSPGALRPQQASAARPPYWSQAPAFGIASSRHSEELGLGAVRDDLLSAALTHVSFCNESQHGVANEALVALGANLLRINSLIWCTLAPTSVHDVVPMLDLQGTRADIAGNVGLTQYLRTGRGHGNDAGLSSVHSDILCACVAAIFLQSPSDFLEQFAACAIGEAYKQRFDELTLAPAFDRRAINDPKTLAQELAQAMLQPITYSATQMTSLYRVVARIGDERSALTWSASARTKTAAEVEAARGILTLLFACRRGDSSNPRIGRWIWDALAIARASPARFGASSRRLVSRALGFPPRDAPWQLQSAVDSVLRASEYFGLAGVPLAEIQGLFSELSSEFARPAGSVVRTIAAYAEELDGALSAEDIEHLDDTDSESMLSQRLSLTISIISALTDGHQAAYDVGSTILEAAQTRVDNLAGLAVAGTGFTLGHRSVLLNLVVWLARVAGSDDTLEFHVDSRAESVTIRVGCRSIADFAQCASSSPVRELIAHGLHGTVMLLEGSLQIELPAFVGQLSARLEEALSLWATIGRTDALAVRLDRLLHDVKNQLVTIGQERRRARETPRTRHAHLAKAESARERARGLLAEVRAAAGPYRSPTFSKLEFGTFVRTIIGDWQSRWPGCLEVRYSSASATIEADEVLLRLVFENLLKNASEAAGPTGTIGIEWALDAEESSVLVEIRNSGARIPLEVSSALSEGKLPPSGKHEGVGLGLAAVDAAVRAHSGRFWIKAEDLGARATVMLPNVCSDRGDS